MKIVKWQDQERVDQNDMESVNDFVLGEFRRMLRALVLTSETSTGIIRGFEVEPQSVPDLTVRVRLNPETQPGAAILAENDGSIITRGQLAGDRGAQAALEGNASYTVDFSLDAPGTYVVEATFLYADGEVDNRAYWNDTSNVEYVAAAATRRLPTLSIVRRASPAGGEWTTLASVVWAGIPLVAAAITDRRDLLFEGVFPNYQTTQSGTGGMPDFDRAPARASVTSDAVYSALRKVGRQIQDLKGPNASGQWDFHSRVVKPMDPSSLLGSGVTKSIATLDSLEYTIGDGTTTWGDFNGATGLQSCLTHIQTAQALLPQRIRIRLKSRRTTISNTEIWAITTGLALTSTKHIELIGDISGTELKAGRVPVKFSETGTSFNFTASTASSLTLSNIRASNVPATSLFLGGSSGRIYLDNAYVVSQAVTINANLTQSIWQNSEIYGEVRLSADNTYQDIDGCLFVNCRFGALNVTIDAVPYHVDGFLSFWRGNTDLISGGGVTRSNRATLLNCELRYDANTTAASSSREACIDLRGSSDFAFENCIFGGWSEANCVLLGNIGADSNTGTSRINFSNCRFIVGGAFNSISSHAVNAGYNGSNGTGWSVYGETLLNTGTITDVTVNCFMRNIAFQNCTWIDCSRIDAGAVKMKNGVVSCSVENCTFEEVLFPIDSGFSPRRRLYFLSFVQDTHYTGYASSNIAVKNCQFGRITSSDSSSHIPHIRHIDITRIRDVRITDCSFACSTAAGNSNKATWASGTSEMIGVRMARCFAAQISNCSFSHFPGTVLAAAIAQAETDLTTYASRFSIKDCYFENSTYGFLLIDASRSVVAFEGNTFDAFGSNTSRIFKADTKLEALSVLRFCNNTVVNPAGGVWAVARLGDPSRVIFMGNDLSILGQVTHDSLTPAGDSAGWNTAPQMNTVNSYF